MIRKHKIGVVTLGCSKNTVDSERLMNQLKVNNFNLVEDPNNADTVIINTCGFIESAKEESINTILEAIELKKAGKIKKVIVAGCLSQRYKDDLLNDISEVDGYFGTENYAQILKYLGGELKYELLGERLITTPSHYAYLKISEGCSNPCSFCAIPLMRGKHNSRPMKSLLEEATFLAKNNVKELIIIGQDTTDYGVDLYEKRNLAELLTKLSEINGIEWIRLLYAYPSHFPKDVINVIAENPKIIKYIDIPLQHISDEVLKSMRRGITSRRTRELLFNLKERIPGLTLRTTFIVGYPNESEKCFNELCEFVKEVEFDKLGVFTYSIEENTPSYILGDPIPEAKKEERKAILMEIQKEISLKKNKNFVGKTLRVIVDDFEGKAKGGFYVARSYRDAPEVDGEILIPSIYNLEVGNFYNVAIYDFNEYDLFGKLR
ncbi:MAG: 30S ribosomal protein S12 methylthiotransferase RimO [Ignavibacteriales bacterium]|nr:30S ribosomal protein S12 methylthiotransferase RimO [Ignavibacteriales bacterium]